MAICEVRDSQALSSAMNISSSVSVKSMGYEASGEAAFDATIEGSEEKAGTSITFYPAGGSGKALPRDKDAILERIESLADDATEAGKLYPLEITPYLVLENVPRDAALMADAGETDQVAAAWALHHQQHRGRLCRQRGDQRLGGGHRPRARRRRRPGGVRSRRRYPESGEHAVAARRPRALG